MEPLLSVNNIKKQFGDKKIINDLSLELKKGQITALIGRSGCGKSTLIKILVGFYSKDSGNIKFEGEEITSTKGIVGYTTQENSFYEKLSLSENMEYYANLYNVIDKSIINSLLKAVKLNEAKDNLAGNISGGMKRRLDFALSLIHKPKFVILDEPTTGLDPVLVEEFWKIVTDIVKEQNIAVLVTTHILDEVKNHCDYYAIMHKGKIVKYSKTNSNILKEFEKYTK